MTTISIDLPQHSNASRLDNPADYNSVLNALNPPKPSVVPFNNTPPSSLGAMNCYAIDITGPGILKLPARLVPTRLLDST